MTHTSIKIVTALCFMLATAIGLHKHQDPASILAAVSGMGFLLDTFISLHNKPKSDSIN